MTDIASLVPDEIRRLQPDDSPFEGYRLSGTPCDVLIATYPAGTHLEAHRHHDMDIVGVVTAGQVRLTVDGSEATYRAGDWFKVPVSAEHEAHYEATTVEVEFMFAVPAKADD